MSAKEIKKKDIDLILSNSYEDRKKGCMNALKENNIDKEIFDLRIFRLIYSTKASPSSEDKQKFQKAVELLKKYINSHGKELNFESLSKNEINDLFLDYCCDYKSLNVDLVKKFFDHGADVNVIDENKLKPLHYAFQSNDVDVLREFLKRGADLNEKHASNDKNTIWTLSFEGIISFEKLKLFIENGARLNDVNNVRGDTVLMVACNNCELNSVEYLIQKGVDVKIKNNFGQTALHVAAKFSPGCIKLLVDKGCDINLIDKEGNTPLLIAVYANNIDSTRELIKLGANVGIKNKNGKTAYEEALSRGYKDIILLIKPSSTRSNAAESSSEFSKVEKLKMEIIGEFKKGKVHETFDKEGSCKISFSNGSFISTDYNYDLDQVTTRNFKNEEEALSYLAKSTYGKNSELDVFKSILKELK